MAARTNSSWAPLGPRSRSRPSFKMRFKCANRISIFLRSFRDCSKPSELASKRAASRACSWMSRGILRDGFFGQHFGLSGHTSQSSLLARSRSVLPSCTGAACPQLLTAGAMIDVVGPVISKVAAREGAVIPLRIVEHGDVWRDALFLDQPVQHRSRTVSCIPDKPLRLEAEAFLCSLDHGLCRPDLGLPNGAGGLNVNDNAELHIDEIVVGVSKEGRSLVSAGPLGCRIGRRDKLRDNLAGSAPRRIVEGPRYPLPARLDFLGSRSLCQSGPAIERCLLASAAIRLASTAKPSPTSPAAIHASTTRSN